MNSFKALPVNLPTLIGLYLTMLAAIVPILLLLAGSIGLAAHNQRLTAGAVVIGFLILILATILQAAYIVYAVKTARAELIGYKEVLRVGLEKALPLLGLGLLIGLLVIVGLVLFIIPGVLFVYWFIFSPYILIDQNSGIIEALKRSRRLVKGQAFEIGGLIGANMIFALPSLIPFVGNLYQLVYTPVTQIAFAYRYSSATALARSGKAKPPTDPANYWALVAVLIVPLILLLLVGVSLIGSLAHHH